MNRLARWMMCIYPARWRRRYGDELDALISDTGADARIVANLVSGGIRMQFSTWSFARLAVVLGMIGVFLGVAASFLSKPVYESKATLAMEGTPEQLNELVAWVAPQILSRSDLSSIINDPRLVLYKEELRTTPLDDVIERMRQSIRIAAGQGQTMETFFRYPDAAKAQQTVSRLTDMVLQASNQERATRSSEAPRPWLDVLDTANLPVSATLQRTIEWTCLLFGISIPFLWRKIRGKSMLTWWLLLSLPICAILGSVSGEAIAVFESDGTIHVPGYRYRSTATMRASDVSQKQIQNAIDGALTPGSLAAIIQDRRLLLYSDELKHTPLAEVVQEMKRRLSITPVPGNPNYITVSFEYNDRFKAQQAVQAMMTTMDGQWKRNAPAMSVMPEGDWGPLALLLPASDPDRIGPNRYRFAGEGGFIGLIASALIALIRNRWNPERDIPIDAVSE